MTTTMSAGGGRGGDAHESERSLLSFSGSNLSHHLRHIDTKRAEATEGLLAILYYRVGSVVYRPDLASIFIDLGGNTG